MSKPPRLQNGVSWSTSVLLALTCAAGASVIVALVTWSPTPDSLAAARPDRGTIRIEKEPFDDTQEVELEVVEGPPGQLLATSSGTLTSSTCVPGRTVRSGTAFASIAERRVVALATSVPAYRDIRVSTTGSDVSALRRELVRLGVAKSVGSAAGAATEDLIVAARKLAGFDDSADAPLVVPRGAFAWVPAGASTISSCDAAVGSVVAAGASLATLSPPVIQARIAGAPERAISGARVLVVGGARLSLSDQREVTRRGLARLLKGAPWSTLNRPGVSGDFLV